MVGPGGLEGEVMFVATFNTLMTRRPTSTMRGGICPTCGTGLVVELCEVECCGGLLMFGLCGAGEIAERVIIISILGHPGDRHGVVWCPILTPRGEHGEDVLLWGDHHSSGVVILMFCFPTAMTGVVCQCGDGRGELI